MSTGKKPGYYLKHGETYLCHLQGRKYHQRLFLLFSFLFQIANAIPLLTQSDLDKAIEILDRSQHLNSLRILLSLPNGVSDSTAKHKTGAVNSLMMPPSNPKVGSLFGNGSKPFYVSGRF